MSLDRRHFLKVQAASAAAAVAGISLPLQATPERAAASPNDITWMKAPCRYCGVGCGVMVGTQDNKVVSTHADPLAPVNHGRNCVKGYFLPKILYGDDRLTTPLLRMRNGRYDKSGQMTPVSWEQAFTIMAEKWKAAQKAKGPNAVGMFGSGQWTIWEGYAAIKLLKAGLRTNNIEPNARHCMASAVVATLRAFGIDEPAGCYDDIEYADDFILWGANTAEMHPVLWQRISARRLTHPGCKVHTLSTFKNRSFDFDDNNMLMAPQSDLVILNYIANYLIQNNAINHEFIRDHVKFSQATADIGYGLPPDNPLQQAAKNPNSGKTTAIDFEQYQALMAPYTLEYAHQMSGSPKENLEQLARAYADPNRKTMSLWCMGINQHVRGVWANNSIYNLHLLTGKISEPGNSPFSLTGQPSACGTAREVGTFSHRLPADMLVTVPAHRHMCEQQWGLPEGTIPAEVGDNAVEQNRKLRAGKTNVYWTLCTNNVQAAANINHEVLPGYLNPENFIIVSDAYPTATAMAADLVLPSAMWVEKEGGVGNGERRTQFWYQMVTAPNGARSDLWQLMEFAKYFTTDEMWPPELLAKQPELAGKTLFQVLFENGKVNQFPSSDCLNPLQLNDEAQAFGFYPQKGLFAEYAYFGRGHGHDLDTFDSYHLDRGKLWPVVKGKETRWRFNDKYDPYAKAKWDFYGNKDGKAIIIANPYEPPAESPDAEYDLWFQTGRVLEHWHTSTMTGRVPELMKAMPTALLYMNPSDAQIRGLKEGDEVVITSRRGSINSRITLNDRNQPPEGLTFMAFFDARHLVNKLLLDATDPISKETDYKKCAVNVRKA